MKNTNLQSSIIGHRSFCQAMLLTIFILFELPSFSQSLTNKKVDGYKPIWFELNQKYEYGDKYSGALGTYTAKHIPLAIYAPEVDKTFFVFGGTTSEDERHLLCMAGVYDHKTKMVSKPTVVFDKEGVNDPHDNPSIMIDNKGHIRVFVSGRGKKRLGLKFISKEPYSIDGFFQVGKEEFTYPQPWNTEFGYFHFFTKYEGVRQLYYETTKDGMRWTDDKLLAAIPEKEYEFTGHYQISNVFGNKVVGTFFNRHPQGNVDKRTDLYYVQSADNGTTWTNAIQEKIELPITSLNSASRVIDYRTQNKNVYIKDMGFDSDGNPACLYIRSNGHEPGPVSAPYEWCITKWNGKIWQTTLITTSDQNYDMGSLYISGKKWKVVGPTEIGPQEWGVGGELAVWQSNNSGKTWRRKKKLTKQSDMSHSYVRRPVNFKAPFCFFWADGNSHEFSKSELYFGDFKGNIWKLPSEMTNDYEKPQKVKSSFLFF